MTVWTRSDSSPDGGHKLGSAPAARKRRRGRVDLLPYALVSPLALFIVLLALVPAAFTIVESFYKVQALNPPNRFSGLDNFRRLFSVWGASTGFRRRVVPRSPERPCLAR
jgi:multiple sugar transport system permease protein